MGSPFKDSYWGNTSRCSPGMLQIPQRRYFGNAQVEKHVTGERWLQNLAVSHRSAEGCQGQSVPLSLGVGLHVLSLPPFSGSPTETAFRNMCRLFRLELEPHFRQEFLPLAASSKTSCHLYTHSLTQKGHQRHQNHPTQWPLLSAWLSQLLGNFWHGWPALSLRGDLAAPPLTSFLDTLPLTHPYFSLLFVPSASSSWKPRIWCSWVTIGFFLPPPPSSDVLVIHSSVKGHLGVSNS